MKLFDFIVSGYEINDEDSDLVDILDGLCWCEIETTEQEKPKRSRFLLTRNGVSAYYDYGADYYFFEEERAS